jgi:hypothetical protein
MHTHGILLCGLVSLACSTHPSLGFSPSSLTRPSLVLRNHAVTRASSLALAKNKQNVNSGSRARSLLRMMSSGSGQELVIIIYTHACLSPLCLRRLVSMHYPSCFQKIRGSLPWISYSGAMEHFFGDTPELFPCIAACLLCNHRLCSVWYGRECRFV